MVQRGCRFENPKRQPVSPGLVACFTRVGGQPWWNPPYKPHFSPLKRLEHRNCPTGYFFLGAKHVRIFWGVVKPDSRCTMLSGCHATKGQWLGWWCMVQVLVMVVVYLVKDSFPKKGCVVRTLRESQNPQEFFLKSLLKFDELQLGCVSPQFLFRHLKGIHLSHLNRPWLFRVYNGLYSPIMRGL